MSLYFPFEHKIINDNNSSICKYRIASENIIDVLTYLKNNPESCFGRLNTIIAVDLGDEFELIYDVNSTLRNESLYVSVLLNRNSPHIKSITEIYKSAHFEECEIYDLFGIKFDNNKKLKRLFLPKGWIGHPLRKDYKMEDKRLSWSMDE